jgi:hypothetical protein
VSRVRDGWGTDDELLAALHESLLAHRAVPPEFIEMGKAAYAWHNIDAELAQLTYDSTHEHRAAAALRAEDASIRTLTFSSEHLTIELEVTGDALLGQIIPVQTGTVEVQTRTGSHATVEIDEMGYFAIQLTSPGPFRLLCRTADGIAVLTGWLTL